MSAQFKILVVDDEDDVEQLIRQKFRRQIRENLYAFLFAKNGVEALAILKENTDVDLVFSDINMPQMDGLTLLGKLGEQAPLLKTVIISAYGDMANIRVAMNQGAFDFICKPFDFDDFERTLAKALKTAQQIKETIQAIQENNILKMYVDNGVLQFMCCKEFEHSLLSTEMIDASILFIDICGFTAISERESPDAVVAMLNTYFDAIVKAIIAEDGYVDKFMGDAVLAVYKGPDHLSRAARAALLVNTSVASLSHAFAPKVSIGLNTGELIAGNIGSATLRRFDFTVIGDVVNTAQRLQAAAQPGQILITRETRDKLPADFQCAAVGEISLKNKQRPVEVWELED